MKSVDISALKRKFGLLLSYVVIQCGMSIELLDAKIRINDYFDFLEKGDIDSFLKEDNSVLCFNLFGARENNSTTKIRNDLLYAGECYISISISLSLPLRKLFILYPLDKMLELYPTYHEMAPFRIIDRVRNDIKDKSVFSIMLEKSDYTINQLSKITSIDRRFLKALKDNPKFEEKLTNEELYNLALVLNMNELFFTESRFIPFYFGLWNDEVFISYMKSTISNIINVNKDILFFRNVEDKQYEELIKNKKSFVYLSYHESFIIKNGRKSFKVPSEYFDLAIIFSVKQYKKYCLDNEIAFC